MTTKKKKKIQGLEEPNPGVVVVGSTSTFTSSSTTPYYSSPPDRISELPVEILHRILGFLEMDECLIGTSLVSTKWRNLWKSVSVLNFPRSYTTSDNGGGDGIRNNVEKYHNFVDHVLRLRDSQASKIQIFRYYCNSGGGGGGYDYLLERLHNFIVSAVVNQGAQDIQILTGRYSFQTFHQEEEEDATMIIHFNPSIFTSGLLLRNFTFKVFNDHYLIQFPRSMCCATQLTHLALYNIRLPEDSNAAAELHLVCPVLDTLLLHCCYSKHLKVLDISAPRLNSLSINNDGMRNGRFDGLGGCRLEIHTPNLTSFDYSGCVFVDCFTENLPCITVAELRFSKETDMVEKTNSFAIKLLKGLTSAHFLTLAGFEVFSQDTLSGRQLTPFTSLTQLCFITSCNISSIHGMVHILNNCNTLEVLYWIQRKISTVESGDEHLMIPQCRLSHLKRVRIQNLRGHESEIEFVKFLLKSSIVLEYLIIITTRKSPKQTIEENLKQFIEEEPSFRSIKLQIL